MTFNEWLEIEKNTKTNREIISKILEGLPQEKQQEIHFLIQDSFYHHPISSQETHFSNDEHFNDLIAKTYLNIQHSIERIKHPDNMKLLVTKIIARKNKKEKYKFIYEKALKKLN